ncbi:hypothetical protein KP509_34G045100 [Ceratopteris richardii]|uniref:Saposin B-type domain-containing protein n=1 Tax=Ceratopteris richardii TaxID=49495 RepID=A0A8T2QLW6_CERRI|nr:hypothetical protein KP509_34G045100 [Ceratopteris richardii]
MASVSAPIALLFVLVLMVPLAITAKPSKPASPAARKGDVKYIKCATCMEIAKELSRLLQKKRNEVSPKQVSEYQIIELVENICNLKKFEADWILHEDIVEQGDKLVLVYHEEEGECKTECKTIEKTCQEVIGYHDTDVAEFMFKRTVTVEELSNFLCKDLTESCRGKIPAVPKDRVPGEDFIPKSSKDAEIERIMKSMSDMPGAPGMKVYSKDDLMNGMPNFNGDDDDDDDDDEDDEDMPVKQKPKATATKKLLHDGQSLLGALKKRTQKVVASAKKHAWEASERLHRWWSGPSKSKTSDSRTEL